MLKRLLSKKAMKISKLFHVTDSEALKKKWTYVFKLANNFYKFERL